MHFVKMEGCGNDYIYVDQEKEQIVNPQTLARKISDRHFGVGADAVSYTHLTLPTNSRV